MSKALSTLTDNLPLFGKLLHCLLYRCYESACFCNYLFLIEPIILDQKLNYLIFQNIF